MIRIDKLMGGTDENRPEESIIIWENTDTVEDVEYEEKMKGEEKEYERKK